MSAQAALPLAAPTPAAVIAAPTTPAPAAAPAAAPAPVVKTESTPPKTEGEGRKSLLGGPEEATKQPEGEPRAQDGDKPKPAGELEIKLPEGMKANDGLLSGFKTVAAKAGLTSEQATSVAVEMVQQMDTVAKAQVESWEKQGETWAKEIEADPELGGAKLKETGMLARRAIRQYGGEPLAQFLEESGLGNNPVLVRAFRAVGAAMSEDDSTVPKDGAATPPPLDAKAQLIRDYPNSFNADGSEKK